MSAQVLAAIIVGLVVLLILLFLYWNCRCRSEPTSTPRRPRGGKDELHGGQAHNRLQNAPPPPDHSSLIVRADELHGGQAQNGQRNAPPPPPAFLGTNSSSSEPDNPLPPPPPPPAFLGTNSSSSGPDDPLPPPPPPPAFLGTNSSSSGPDNSLPPQPLIIVFTYQELERATVGFSDVNLIGRGGFGYVHKGVLPNGKEVAVKQLKSGSGQGEREFFQAEVEIISRVHHRHLISLVGYCISKKKRLLVYEFVPNNTLHFHLHGEGRPTMDWPTRLKIALGSAKGLAYLHEDCIHKIIHRDIKGTNILLNFDFEVKIADFGLAKIVPDNNTHVTTRIMGTDGYFAPEYFFSGKLTDKSDVYSFGVMLLELITGRRPVREQDSSNDSMQEGLVVWAKPLLTRAIEKGNYEPLVDPRLQKNYNPNEMEQMVSCAAACVRHTAKHRPRMSQVVKVLEGDVSPENLKVGAPPMRTGRT